MQPSSNIVTPLTVRLKQWKRRQKFCAYETFLE